MPFYAPGFDPVLIISQIAALQARRVAAPRAGLQRHSPTLPRSPADQSLLYMSLGLWLVLLNGLAGSSPASISLRHLFSPDVISISYAGGWITIVALFLNAVAGCAQTLPIPSSHGSTRPLCARRAPSPLGARPSSESAGGRFRGRGWG